MISHAVRQEVVNLGSMIAYYVWESPNVNIPIQQNFYWHDKNCTKSVGPFPTLFLAMEDYGLAKRAQKALQRRGIVQELQIGKSTGYMRLSDPQLQTFPRKVKV
jgi:hypothetical protein